MNKIDLQIRATRDHIGGLRRELESYQMLLDILVDIKDSEKNSPPPSPEPGKWVHESNKWVRKNPSPIKWNTLCPYCREPLTPGVIHVCI